MKGEGTKPGTAKKINLVKGKNEQPKKRRYQEQEENGNEAKNKIMWSKFTWTTLNEAFGQQLAAEMDWQGENVYIIPDKTKLIQPSENGLYPHFMPGPKNLSVAKDGKKIFTVEIRLERKTQTVNKIKITTLRPKVFVPHYVLEENDISVLFAGNSTIIWVADQRKRKKIFQQISTEAKIEWNKLKRLHLCKTDGKVGPAKYIPPCITRSGMIQIKNNDYIPPKTIEEILRKCNDGLEDVARANGGSVKFEDGKIKITI